MFLPFKYDKRSGTLSESDILWRLGLPTRLLGISPGGWPEIFGQCPEPHLRIFAFSHKATPEKLREMSWLQCISEGSLSVKYFIFLHSINSSILNMKKTNILKMPLRFQVLFKINEADCLIPVLVTRSFGVYTSLRLCLGLSSNRLSADTHSLRPQVFSSPVSPSVEDAQYFNRKWIQPSVPLKKHWFLLCSTQGQRREPGGSYHLRSAGLPLSLFTEGKITQMKWRTQASDLLWPCIMTDWHITECCKVFWI